MSVAITNISYYPPAFVQENGGSIVVEFDVALDCSPEPAPELFTWQVAFKDALGGTVHTELGTETGSAARVTAIWAAPEVPDGGVRPYITVSSECSGEMTLGFCTGITRVRSFRPLNGAASCST